MSQHHDTANPTRWHALAGGCLFNIALGSYYAWSVFVKPLQTEFETRVNRFFFRERYDAQRLLHDVAHRSRAALDLSDIASPVVTSIFTALKEQLGLQLDATTKPRELQHRSRGVARCELRTRRRTRTA